MDEGREIRFIDLFSGVGGIRLGLERANSGVGAKLTAGKGGYQDQKGFSADSGSKDGNGRRKHTNGSYRREEGANRRLVQENERPVFRCVWSCDNNKHANQVYTKHFGEENHYSNDIRGVDPREIPDFDLLCAGFPCPSFSVAGKRKGFQDDRGTLFFEICRIAEAKRPSLLLLENVKGLLSSERGQVFYTILQSLEDLGYWIEWHVLNSKHFGVPQTRERIFIIGHLGEQGGRAVFPIVGGNGEAFKELEKIGNIAETGHDSLWGRVYDPRGLAMNLNAEGGGVGAKTGLYAISFTNPHNPEEERRSNISNISRSVKPPYGNQQPLVLADRTRSYAGLGRNLEAPKEVTNALSTVQKDNLLLKNFRIRTLTPMECERLQGFPDGWTEKGIAKKGDIVWTGKYGINKNGKEYPILTKAKEDGVYPLCDTPRRHLMGNAVTVNVIEFLGYRIMDSMGVDILDKKVNRG